MRSKEDVGEKCNYTTSPIPPERRGGYKDYWLASDLLEYTSHPFEGHLFNENMEKVEFNGYRVDCLTDFALEYLDSINRKKPFFLFISYLEPHQQNDINQIVGPRGSKNKFIDFRVPGDLEGREGDWKEFFPDYLGCCHSIDENLKKIEKKLGKLKILDNTIIFYTSDHGCHFRTRNNEYKRSCHDSSIHIPLIIKGSGFLGGNKISELVSLIDIPPTLLKCAGIEPPKHMRGRPLQDLVNGTAKNWPQEVFVQISETQVGRALRTKRWKYSVRAPKRDGWLYAKSNLYMEDFLYDLENDPYEKSNLVDNLAYEQVRAELAVILKRKMAEVGEDIPQIIPKTSD
jgi:arylsulfatase A-like enzyme